MSIFHWSAAPGRAHQPARKTPDRHLLLETLEDRNLLAATVDLSTAGAEGVIGGAIFRQADAQPAGAEIRSFVRLQDGWLLSSEQGYNTDARPLQFETIGSPSETRALRLSEIPQVTIGGQIYYEFLLDINQSSSGGLLSLDQLRIYSADSPNLSGYNSLTKQLAGRAPLYDMDAGAGLLSDRWVKLSDSLNGAGGSGDALVYLPASKFAGAGEFVYLFSRFGDQLGHVANGAAESWAVRVNQVTSSLSGFVYFDADNDGIFDADEEGLADVVITLFGTDSAGNEFSLSLTTDSNGFYSFTGLAAGAYRLVETQAEGYGDGLDTIGTQGGSTGDDAFDIVLEAGVDGQFNNFGETYLPS